MSGESEEKTLEPTEHKLRKAREKGQIASSQDFVTAAVTISALLYILFSWNNMAASAGRIFGMVLAAIPKVRSAGVSQPFYATVAELGNTLIPLVIIITMVGIGANIIHKRGIPFSLHPVTPDFSKINPGQLFKKLFSRRNGIEFGISLFRIVVWFIIAGVIVWLATPSIMASALCDGPCFINPAMQMVAAFAAAVIVLLLIAGLLDLPLQTALFRHEQKMGHQELKRELKDTMGNPEVKSARRNAYQDLQSPTGGGRTGRVSIVIVGNGVAVSLFYHPADAPVPIVVGKFSGESLRDVFSLARARGWAIANDARLASDLHRTVSEGTALRERHFGRVATHLINTGVL
ncbi:hypothetical protein CSC94_14525 [Zhengella mangrovi]|uniref:Translocation protein in type III secretion system, RhcU n=1 Tax=Zhengella mangrovi TaxID=1982044 RepID=A0A2G1QM13_9HYPH|nr:EscU/YscU/HrcU family type III secretion system export apparatus switch protein [Zhengella mangrovi]PHP66490.1 hypothetical protein CSC94_14525 [Zhengella mangrovi]